MALSLEIAEYRASRPKIFKNDDKIRNYLFNWISRSGRAAIFTRDMSWVKDDDMREMLRRKARNDELAIIAPAAVGAIADLKNHGAKVHLYGDLQYRPLSRFSIVNQGRADAKVAVARLDEGVLYVKDFDSREDPSFSLATDLVEIVERAYPAE